MHVWPRRPSRRTAFGLILALCGAVMGCSAGQAPSLLPPWGSSPDEPGAEVSAVESSPTWISYRTSSDRLNVSAGAIAGVQMASFQQPAGGIPSVTHCTLLLRYPHPQGWADMAQAVLTVEPKTRTSDDAWSWTSILPAALRPEGETKSKPQPLETWVTEVPKWQMDAIFEKLREQRFFNHHKTFEPVAFVGTEVNGRKFGKDYRQIEELDALILRMRAQGRLLGGTAVSPPVMHAANSAPWQSGVYQQGGGVGSRQ